MWKSERKLPVDTLPRGCLGLPLLTGWGDRSPLLTARSKEVRTHQWSSAVSGTKQDGFHRVPGARLSISYLLSWLGLGPSLRNGETQLLERS